jgi:hypothetical protein
VFVCTSTVSIDRFLLELVSLLVQHATLPPDGCDEEKRVILKDADHEQVSASFEVP